MSDYPAVFHTGNSCCIFTRQWQKCPQDA